MKQSQKIRVAFVTNPLDSTLKSSISIATCSIATRLVKDCSSTIYTSWDGSVKTSGSIDGLTVKRLRVMPDVQLRRIIGRLPGIFTEKKPFFSSPLYYPNYMLQLALDLRAGGYDIAHLHNFTQFIPVIRFFNPGIKIVLHMHSEWLTQLDEDTMRRRVAQADMVLGCSDFVTKKILLRFPELSDKCATLHNGVNVEYVESEPPENTGVKKVLFVGRISPEKGVHILIKAFEKVAQQYPDALLEIVGQERVAPKEFIVLAGNDPLLKGLEEFYSGSYLERIKKSIPKELEAKIIFTGHVNHSGLRSVYSSSDVLVNPSFYESFGMTVHEAMAHGIPVVATGVGGVAETIENGKTGVLVRPGDADALADAIIRVLRDSRLRQTLRTEGRKSVMERFDWNIIAKKLLGYYRSMFFSTSKAEETAAKPT